MERRIFDILLELQRDMKEVKGDLREVKEVVNRIETSQAEDVIGMLKVTKKKTDFEVDYLNNKLTEMGRGDRDFVPLFTPENSNLAILFRKPTDCLL